jgi:hypothetical protein
VRSLAFAPGFLVVRGNCEQAAPQRKTPEIQEQIALIYTAVIRASWIGRMMR